MTQPQGYVLTQDLPAIPAKRYFTIGEVSTLCGVRSYVLRYWEQEFEQLRPMKRRGNRRYYQHHEVLLVRKIRALLYEEGYTIAGARQQLDVKVIDEPAGFELLADNTNELELSSQNDTEAEDPAPKLETTPSVSTSQVRPEQNQTNHQTWIDELKIARDLLNH
ncbi:hypothetical protein GCM10009007_09670 [Formosimonas limnophila]|uniref:HTH merR-type domain-containing protein n=1 Tax=Formosimonas limnophila TaxID=1384487 RepID=A0A8J3CH62_9BURK|nr:MerR family transcriptional regulator [Formosimonas limnophila]GHA70883.1 hypothetical protein GCM10009007_09670 [Formosimonas limnophila]